MTEAEWWACSDPRMMVDCVLSSRRLGKGVKQRGLRLLACAYCRGRWSLLQDRRSRTAVEVAERFADGDCSVKALAGVHGAANAAYRDLFLPWVDAGGDPHQPPDTFRAAHLATIAADAKWFKWAAIRLVDHSGGDPALAPLLRDVFGPLPFRAVALDPAWRTPEAIGMAQGMYERRAFDGIGDLARALEHAGCDNEAVLDHCRSAGPHVRGCWVVDLILGKQ